MRHKQNYSLLSNLDLGALNQTKVRQGAKEMSNVEVSLEFPKFNRAKEQVTTIARLYQLLSTAERENTRNLSALI